MKKTWLTNTLLILFSLVLGLALIELGLRTYAYRGKVEYGLAPHLKRWARYDPVLGWRNNPGVWEVDCERRPMTLLEDGTRKTRGQNPAASKRVLLAGDSWVQGYGVRDEESLASRLQERFSNVNFINLATAGYGAHQSLLAVKDYQTRAKEGETLAVILGLASHTLMRDVADYRWVKSLTTYAVVHFIPPHILPNPDGGWRAYPPETRNLWGWADRIDLLLLAQGIEIFFQTKGREAKFGLAASKAILRDFAALLTAQGARLLVLNLDIADPMSQEFSAACLEIGVPFIDGKVEAKSNDPAWFLHGDGCWGHPNERMQQVWAERLAPELQKLGVH
jgi:lysophospholipase L1-like esterase